ncbi:MAG TPA: hypothetical protein VGB26_02350 [Nitrospiria bacterium]|jgi:hypothetical protein
MKLDFNRIQKDLQKGIKTLLQTSGEWSRNVAHQSSHFGFRLRMNQIENQLEDCFQEIGKRVHHLKVSEGEGDFSKDPEVNRFVQEASDLVNERDRLNHEKFEKEKESSGG